MKKIAKIIFLCILSIGLYACGGNVSNVQVSVNHSEIYETNDIESAMNVTKKYFKKNFSGCTLNSLSYDGDASVNAYAEWAKRHDADEVIVLTSSFDVNSSGGDGSLNPNSTYDGWKWILVRKKGGVWSHADHGY